MKRKLILLIAGLCFSLRLFAQQEPEKIEETAFKAGEKLTYKLKYGILTAAEAHLRVEDSPEKFEDKPAFHIIADGATAGLSDVIYKVRNRYETYIDKNTLLPFFYTENRKESSYKHTDNVTFDHTKNQIKADKGLFQFKGKVFDFLSAYYFARNIDVSKLKSGDQMEFRYFLEDGIHTLTITYIGREKVKCSLGTFNCLKFNPTIIPGHVFRKDSKLYLWVTDDDNRIPVKAHVEVVIGSVSMELENATGLKYPLKPLSK